MSRFFFKQFSVAHQRSAMKVGTDGVLLGAWAALPVPAQGGAVPGNRTFLDVGCGCGLIALMLAQRMFACGQGEGLRIDAVDIHAGSVQDARENFRDSPWNACLRAIEADFRIFSRQCPDGAFDLMVSNPPFFLQSLKSDSAERNLARHNDSLPFAGLFSQSQRLLREGGSLAMVFPADVSEEVMRTGSLRAPGLRLSRLLRLFPKEGKPCGRVLAQWVKGWEGEAREESLRILSREGVYEAAYLDLVKDFYPWAGDRIPVG